MTRRRRAGWWRPAAVLGVAALAAGGCDRRPAADAGASGARVAAPEVRREAGLDVLLVTIDTLRADALGAYGNGRAETPVMDRLAAAGVRFDDAHAHNVLTLPSHANLLSGLHPTVHGVRDNAGFRFPGGVPTLAGRLAERGYRTGAFVSAFPLASRFGLASGFEVYEDGFVEATRRPAFLEQERSAVETVALARRWLDAADDRPSFCWVHLYEPHFPYQPPPPFDRRFAYDPYLGEVAATDRALAPLLTPILDAGTASNTLVVLTADHGESLGEHGEATHGIFAYEATLRVPLVLHQPRLLAPRIAGAPARHVDIVPTVLDALAMEVPSGLDGRSLLPVAAGVADAAPRATYFEALSGQLNRGWAPLYGVIDEGYKYIALPIPELYDLRRDPAEAVDLTADEPQRAAALEARLDGLRAGDRGAEPRPEEAEVRVRLRDLGYLSGPGAVGRTSFGVDDDPKRLIALDEELRAVAGLFSRGDLAGALAKARSLVRRRPGMRLAWLDLAHLEREAGDPQAAVAALEKALALGPEDPAILAQLAAALVQAGRPGAAVEVTAAHASLPAPDLEVLLTRGLAQARLGHAGEARATLERARAAFPDSARAEVYLGTFFLMGGQRSEAQAAFGRALKLNPRTAAAHSALGIMASEDGRTEEASAHWRAAVTADPAEVDKLFDVAAGLWAGGRRDAARPLLELFVAVAPAERLGGEIREAVSMLGEG